MAKVGDWSGPEFHNHRIEGVDVNVGFNAAVSLMLRAYFCSIKNDGIDLFR